MIGKDGLLRVRSCDSNAARLLWLLTHRRRSARIGPFKLGLLSTHSWS